MKAHVAVVRRRRGKGIRGRAARDRKQELGRLHVQRARERHRPDP